MHTFIRESKEGNYGVGRMVIYDDKHTYEGMFHGLSLNSAISLTNILNGGNHQLSDMSMKTLEYCLVKG